jgi:hypothetical protein
MPLPGSHREKKKEVLQEIVEPEVQVVEEESQPETTFLQEINEPTHDEEPLVEEQPTTRSRRSKKY